MFNLGEIARAMAAGWDYDEKRRQRALELLASWLSDEQLKEFLANRKFNVKGGVSGRTYTIYADTQNYNIVTDNPHNPPLGTIKLCFAPMYDMHWYDKLLGQKLALECDEEYALRISNFSPTDFRLTCS